MITVLGEALVDIIVDQAGEVTSVVGGAPLRRFAKFPGIPLTAADVDAVLASHG